jgi:hypothetical protein
MTRRSTVSDASTLPSARSASIRFCNWRRDTLLAGSK